jgi:hypothetical protein
MEAITESIAEAAAKTAELHMSEYVTVEDVKLSIGDLNKSISDTINSGFNDFTLEKLDGENFEIIGKGGKVIDHVEILKSLEVGDIMKVWQEMGIPEDLLKTEDAITYAAKQKENYLVSEIGKTKTNLETVKKLGKSATKEAGEVKIIDTTNIKSVDELKTEIGEKQTNILDKQAQKFEEELKTKGAKEGGKTEFEYGKFVKSTIKYGLTGLSALMLYNWVKDHQDKMNGCWLVKNEDGTKCKLQNLSCGEVKTKGELCTTILSKCGKKVVNGKTVNGTEACFSDSSCVFWNKNDDGTNTTCAKRLSEVSGSCKDNCSTYCNSTMIECPEGYSLLCVDADFWDAAADFLESPLNVGGDIISKLTNILKYILYGALIIFGLIMLFKIGTSILSTINKKTEEKNTPP